VNALVDPRGFFPEPAAAPIAFVDMYEEELDGLTASRPDLVLPLLVNCRRLLDCARRNGWPTAFVRPNYPSQRRGGPAPHWIEGFKPQRSDMIFERKGASCYSSEEFAGAIDAAGGVFAITGFCGESTALSTLIDAERHGHGASLIGDACSSRPRRDAQDYKAPRAFALVSEFTAIISTQRWIDLMLSPPEGRDAIIR
jgi:nicotinamidase-related amidase